MNEELKKKIEGSESDGLISSKEVGDVNMELENNKRTKTSLLTKDTPGHIWFILIFLVVHFSMILPLFAIFGILINKRWGYYLAILVAIISGWAGPIAAGLYGPAVGESYILTVLIVGYLAFIHPLISLAILILSIKMIRKLGIQK